MSCILPLAHASLSSSVLTSGVRLLPEPSVDLRAASSGRHRRCRRFHEDQMPAPIAERLVHREEVSGRGFGICTMDTLGAADVYEQAICWSTL